MSDEAPTRETFIDELEELRERIADLEAALACQRELVTSLREADGHCNGLAEQVRDGICVLRDGRVAYANGRLAQMCGRTVEEVLGTPFTNYVHPDDLSTTFERYQRSRAGDDIEPTHETVLTQPDGTQVYVELQAGVVSHRGETADLILVRDITERRRMEEWARWRDRLAAIGQLVAGISHEINGALTGIIGFMQLAYTHEGVPAEPKSDIEEAIVLARRMDRFTRHILDLSRHPVPKKRLLDLSDLLRDVAEFLDRTLPMTIRIVLETTPDDFLIYADPVQVQQALTNLALNARDAMLSSDSGSGAGGGEMHFGLSFVSLRRRDKRLPADKEPGNWVALSVSDTGVGIAPQVLPHIYEPFFTTKDIGHGTGLGLAQVHDTVEHHGGFIEVQTEVGVGTTFTLYLPPLS